MIFDYIILIIVIAALIIGSLSDIKTREVPDWLNYGLIFIGFGLRVIYSCAANDWSYIIHGALGFAIFFALACAMFYGGQWGGGDAKMMMGLGALIGFRPRIDDFSVGFVLNAFLIGAVYALIWSTALAISKWGPFVSEAKKTLHAERMRKMKKILFVSAVVILVLALFIDDFMTKIMLFTFVLFCLSTFYLFVFIRAIEKVCMLKLVDPERLTEGDWIAKDVVVGGKKICGPKDLGITMAQIKRLIALKKQKKINKILIKEGIPFVPSFLVAFISAYLFGNLFLIFV